MERQKIIGKIIEFFKENGDAFTECIEELDDWSGYLGDERYIDMENLNEIYYSSTATEILTRAFYGHDEDDWHTNQYGQREYGAFNPNRDYFKFNGYGNLISTDYKDYSEYIDKYAVEEMSDNRRWIDAIDDNEELSKLFDELENEDDENDESNEG